MSVILAVGVGLDLERAYVARQQLSAVARLTCQFANRPLIVSQAFGPTPANYATSVNSYAAAAVKAQNQTASFQTVATPFTYVVGGAGTVALSASVPTALMQIAGIATMPANVSQTCFTQIASAQQPTPDATAPALVDEPFNNSAYPSSIAWYTPAGVIEPYSSGSVGNPVTNVAPTAAAYVGSNGNEWIVMGYCLEVGYYTGGPSLGTHLAELDCDNGSQTAGNSSISTRVYMPTGSYELRYSYHGRYQNLYYKTAYICGSTAADTSWANDPNYYNSQLGKNFTGARTNQVNVYLDQASTTGSPPTHTTIDGTQTLGGSNLIDECVYSNDWIQRSVLINVTTAGYFWLSFAADGASDSYGGDLENILLCVASCTGVDSQTAAGDDFPTSWTNGTLLFEDTFESPTYSGASYNTSGNVGVSIGASSYWGETGFGWGNAPVNQLPYWLSKCPQSNQCIELGWNNNGNNDVIVAKPFLLDPGYYQISYDYVSQNTFTGLSGVYCGATPTAARVSTLAGGSGTATDRVLGVSHGTMSWESGLVGLFMVHAQLASEPNPSATLGSTTTYTSPSGAIESSPSVPPNSISLTSYNAAQSNPVLDICGYAATSQVRTINVGVPKPALYWLVFSMLGTQQTGFGAQLDDVKITALGSPRMSGPPSSSISVPVPNPQLNATLGFAGFTTTVGLY